MEYAKEGDLYDFLKNNILEEEQAKEIFV